MIFVYEKDINAWDNSSLKKYYIHGGRGVGKTRFLKKLAERFYPDSKKNNSNYLWLSGQMYRKVLNFFEDETKNLNGLKHLFIDDLDEFCHLGIQREGSDFEKIISQMDYFFNEKMPDLGINVIASGSSKPERMQFPSYDKYGNKYQTPPRLFTEFWSIIEMSWDLVELFPWNYGWEKDLREKLTHEYDELSSEVITAWEKNIIQMTGGHPSLLGPAVTELDRLVNMIEEIPPVESKLILKDSKCSEIDLDDLICQHLENYLVRTSIKYIRRAIRNIMNIDHPDYHQAFECLKKLAIGEDVEISYNIRAILFEEALVYQDKNTGEYAIPGDLVKEEIRRHCDFSKTIKTIHMEPDSREPEQRGFIVSRLGNKDIRVRLFGGPWKIAHILFKEANSIVSLAKIESKTTLKTESAVRSAIQRLDNKLRENGLINIIENIRGEGYRMQNPEGKK